MNAKIEEITVARPMSAFRAGPKVRDQAWLVTGGRYEIETRTYEAAIKYAAAIDAGNDDEVQRMLDSARREAGA